MEGYSEPYGYVGLIDGQYMIFADEGEYEEYYSERNKEDVRIKRQSSVTSDALSV